MKRTQNWRDRAIDFVVTLLIFLITFPRFEPVFGTGLDLSYTWAFNYLILNDYDTLTRLIYPIGPLGFLKYVAAFENNLLLGLVSFSVVKLSLIFLLLRLDYATKGKHSIISVLLIIIASYFSNFDFSIIGSTIILLLLFNQKSSKYYFIIIANLFALFGLFIKSSIGITAYSAIFSYLIYLLFNRSVKLKRLIGLLSISILIFVLGGIFVFKGFIPFISFLYGIIQLAGGYSSGLALYPENNWWLLSGFVISVLIIPFLLKERSTRLGFILLILPFFAMWKHAMGREDIYHIQILIGFTLLMWSILFAISKKYSVWFFILPVFSLTLFYLNMKNIPLYNQYHVNTSGFSNFNETVIHFGSLNSKYKSISEEAIQTQVLKPELRSLIGESSIDVYPWELSYIPANQLNWKPRKTLELGASTSSWLANKCAAHFTGDESPEFVLFQLINDKWGGKFGSLDGRYLLNDEPQLIFNLLANYHLEEITEHFLLFRKGENIKRLISKSLKNESVSWNEWINVPRGEKGIFRTSFSYHKNLVGKIKTFFYKDEAYFIDYRLTDGKIVSYRFLPSNAKDGLWINPLITDPFGLYAKMEVLKIRFRCSNQLMISDRIELNWQNILPADENEGLLFFEKFDKKHSEELFSFHENFEIPAKLERTDRISFSGNFSEIVGMNQFSTSFTISLDSIWDRGIANFTVETSVMYKSENIEQTKAMLVMTMQDSQNNFWTTFPFKDNGIENEWNYAFLKMKLDKRKYKSGTVKIYIWNKGNGKVYIDDITFSGYH